jgi:hypothetical protein
VAIFPFAYFDLTGRRMVLGSIDAFWTPVEYVTTHGSEADAEGVDRTIVGGLSSDMGEGRRI